MNDKIYWRGTSKVTPMTHQQIRKAFKAMDNKSNGLVACGKSFNELMKELNNAK